MTPASIAINRFGLGGRADDPPVADPERWLQEQFDRYEPRPAALSAAPSSTTIAAGLVEYRQRLRGERADRRRPAPSAVMLPAQPPGAAMSGAMAAMPAPPAVDRSGMQMIRKNAREAAYADYGALAAARTVAALTSDAPFVERLVQFWANHFAISADKLDAIGLAGTLEMEAIRPHVLGRFADMLNAVERHPAMLVYLDQVLSVGPNSPVAGRVGGAGRRTPGLNENLAREIFELHTLGVRTGYTQGDVTEFARAMTGRTLAGLGRGRQEGRSGSYVFAPALHEPGARTILGKSYPQPEEAQSQAVLDDLAVAPATATHIATKLTRHFAGDTPPPAMVARLAAAFATSRGDLPTVYRAIIDSPEAWVAGPVKFRTPWEWTLASMRALGLREVKPAAIVGLMNQLGQPVWKPGQPIGYDDLTATWAGPNALLRRVEAAERFAAHAPATLDARALALHLYPGLGQATQDALARAESAPQALALMLVAPEALRR